MNLAFPAIFLFAVLLPGLIFRRTYNRGYLTTPPPDLLADEIARSPVPAGLLHLVWGWGCHLIGHPIHLKAAIALVLGNFGKDSSFFDEALNSVANHSIEVATYFLSIYLSAAIFGYICHLLVWGLRLDLALPFLKSRDYWFYLFRGESPAPPALSEIKGVRVSAVVDCAEDTLIYRGYFYHYTGHGGKLDEVWLRSGERRRLSEDKPEDPLSEKFYKIPGDLLILKASEIRTINLKYVTSAELAALEPTPLIAQQNSEPASHLAEPGRPE